MSANPEILSAAEARVLAAGITTHELLLVLAHQIGDAARRGETTLYVGEDVVRGVRDWNSGLEGVIGEAVQALRRQGYIVRKSMTPELQPCLRIDWKAETSTGGYWDR